MRVDPTLAYPDLYRGEWTLPLVFSTGRILDTLGRKGGAALIFTTCAVAVAGSYLLEGKWPLTAALTAGVNGVIILDRTPFYAESGGQVGDRGQLVASRGTFHVNDTQKIQAEVFGHHGVLHTGTLAVGDTVDAKVDVVARTRAAARASAFTDGFGAGWLTGV